MENNINEIDIMPGAAERFVIKIDDIEQSMGLWYSLFALRIVPFLLYIIPVNVILAHAYRFVLSRFVPDAGVNGTVMLVMWIVLMIGFIAVTVISPKLATVVELGLGFMYLYLAFRHHLFNTLLGYSVLTGIILFLLVKLVFLAFKLVRIKAFANDGEGIERDESGRIVRASEDDVFFTDENPDGDEPAVSTDDYFFADGSDKANRDDEVAVKADDDFFFAGSSYNADDNGIGVSSADDDFFFG